MNTTVEIVMENLRKNNLNPTFAPRLSDVRPLVDSMLQVGDTVAVGGSVTLDEADILSLLHEERYHFLDRYAPGLTRAEQEDIFRQSFAADVYLCSSNAVTENGELYNVDGTGNRVAALAYGPKKVILVVGINKIVPDLDAAIKRVKTCASPRNTARLGFETYCQKTGHCMKVDGSIGEGCLGDKRICCSYLVTGYQRNKERIHVILVGEECGY